MPNDLEQYRKDLQRAYMFLVKLQWFFIGVTVAAIFMPILQHVLS